ncbi:hypothetical protein AJ79_04039 [Helicocarpus griseus UAMH5409]|uniref:Cytochrome P450 n=1 Tax=Helicocarpus griseus UAMH5409 TaxID=1447875 RepID=A0A2B7XV43_9EURO|nr:hypothetical protein AJ79_04039 [Helicocarpus griseus UAMH5409]
MSYLYSSLISGLTAYVAYLLSLAVYRLYFHPLAKFPGPKYAALSRWHEFYYDVYAGGKLIFWIEELHKKYGPIVRITPDEIHVIDSDFWDTLFTKAGRVDKYEYLSGRFGNESSVLTTPSDSLHRLRRGALNPFFSRKRIVDLQSIIRGKLKVLMSKLNEYKNSGAPATISRGYLAMVEDIIMEYCFAFDYNHLEMPGWTPTLHDPFRAVSITGNLALHVPWLPKVMNSLPRSFVLKLEPLYAAIFRMQDDFGAAIKKMKREKPDATAHATVFSELLNGDLPPKEKADKRLQDEAQLIIGAGLATTGWTLSVGTYFLLSNPKVLARLQEELGESIPELSHEDPTKGLDWIELEKLPYLTAVIKESVRLSYSTTSRNVRILPKPIQYGDWVIPARTPISMTIPFLNHDEEIFPDSRSFIPERWLDNPKTSDGSSLDRYFFGFGKGTRSCLGINLAYCELYLTFAAIFRYFDFDLYKTDRSDVDIAHDYFLPFPKLDSEGIRVRVKGDRK